MCMTGGSYVGKREQSKAKQLVKEDEWVWGQHAYRIEVWGIWGREGACEIK